MIYIYLDIEVNEEGDDFKIRTDTDNQLNYAIKLLNGNIIFNRDWGS